MLIILEGCDGVGKTTLANMLHSMLDESEIIHCNTETPNDFEFFKRIVQAASKKHIIADRFCYGQFVYQEEDDRPLNWDKGEQEFYDGYSRLHALETYMLDKPYPIKLIYVYTDPETACKRIIERDGDEFEEIGGYTMLDTVTALMKGYERLWTKSLLQPIYFKT